MSLNPSIDAPLDVLWDKLPSTTRSAFERYLSLLTKWQKTINLVSPSTLAHARDRHILDSYQLADHIPNSVRTLYDLGSGAGFPALVLAITRPEIAVSLFESDGRKCEFLKTISREIIPATIHMGRIESLSTTLPAPDLITARALAALDQLFDWALPWVQVNPKLIFLLPKGERWADEVELARQKYNFDIEDFPSITDKSARILKICNISPKV